MVKKILVLVFILAILSLAYAPPIIEGPGFESLTASTTIASGNQESVSSTTSGGGPVLNQGTDNPFSAIESGVTPVNEDCQTCGTILQCLACIDQQFVRDVFK